MRLNICGKRVKIARVQKDMKQADLAAALSVDHGIEIDQKGISNLEIGEKRVTDIDLIALSKVLDVTVNWLLYGEEK